MSIGDDTGKSGLLDDAVSFVDDATVIMAAGEEFCRGGMEGDDPSSPATLDFFNCIALHTFVRYLEHWLPCLLHQMIDSVMAQ